jgi:hypothetical protein
LQFIFFIYDKYIKRNKIRCKRYRKFIEELSIMKYGKQKIIAAALCGLMVLGSLAVPVETASFAEAAVPSYGVGTPDRNNGQLEKQDRQAPPEQKNVQQKKQPLTAERDQKVNPQENKNRPAQDKSVRPPQEKNNHPDMAERRDPPPRDDRDRRDGDDRRMPPPKETKSSDSHSTGEVVTAGVVGAVIGAVLAKTT